MNSASTFQEKAISRRGRRHFGDELKAEAVELAGSSGKSYYGLFRYDVPVRDALTWTARAREAGVRSRFTLPASASLDALGQLLR